MIGRDSLGKKAQPGVAVALRNVAEDLVVGAVLLDDVDAVLDRARLAELGRDRIARLAVGRPVGLPSRLKRATRVGRLGQRGHLAQARACR